MPELITHTTFAYIIRKRKWDNYKIILFLFGSMLPDLLSRPFTTLFPYYSIFFNTFHTPLVLVLWLILLSQFFAKEIRFEAFKYLSYGTATHLFLDLFQINIKNTGYGWFFPFTDFDLQLGIIWPEETLFVIPFFLLLFLIDVFISKKKKSKQKTFSDKPKENS